jgi:hypothetical protein
MESSETDRELRAAIAERSLVMFEYADLIRVVEPHRYGINSAGHRMLSGWLRAGYSRSDPSGGWRNYLLRDISAFQRLAAPFAGARPGFAPHDPRMREVYAELPAPAVEAAESGAGPFIVGEPGVPEPMSTPALTRASASPEASRPVEAARTQDGEIDPPEAHA